jgi:hypothetical protein
MVSDWCKTLQEAFTFTAEHHFAEAIAQHHWWLHKWHAVSRHWHVDMVRDQLVQNAYCPVMIPFSAIETLHLKCYY